ncbi:MAG: hypothetical protein RL846_11010, partial [Deltaproteobacteria bacterium]
MRRWVPAFVLLHACGGTDTSSRAPATDAPIVCPPGTTPTTMKLERWDMGAVRDGPFPLRRGCLDANQRLHGPVIDIRNTAVPPVVFGVGQMNAGKRTGRWVDYAEDGAVIYVGHYDEGLRHGPYEHWYPDGAIAERGEFDHGRRVGKRIEFNTIGDVMRSVDYRGRPRHAHPTPTAAPADAPSPWPTDALWDLGQMVVVLAVLLGLWSRRTRRSPLALVKLPERPLASPAVRMLVAGAITTSGGWLLSASHLGFAQTVAMALGGPSYGEILRCHSNQLLVRESVPTAAPSTRRTPGRPARNTA